MITALVDAPACLRTQCVFSSSFTADFFLVVGEDLAVRSATQGAREAVGCTVRTARGRAGAHRLFNTTPADLQQQMTSILDWCGGAPRTVREKSSDSAVS